MSESKRETLFPAPVYVRDVEEKSGEAQPVPRHLVLPLPRSYDEAADWCTRCRKGTRVYAMYPSTTSLYGATVIDSTTYCRGEDDIIVVEFDGDEDDFGNLPQRHIPARFVSLVPHEFPAANANGKRKTSSGKKNPHVGVAAEIGGKDASSSAAIKVTKRRSSAKGGASQAKKNKKSIEGPSAPVETYGNADFEKDLFDVFGNGTGIGFS